MTWRHVRNKEVPGVCARHEITPQTTRPRAFDRQKQLFRCSRCPFKAELRLTVDLGFAHDRQRAGDQ